MVPVISVRMVVGAVLNMFVLMGILAASSANAQVNTTSTQAILRGLTAPAPGASVSAVGTGAVVTSNGTVLVPASGLKIPVPVSVAANVSKARIASAALGCTSPLGAAVCAATAAAVAENLLNQPTGVGRYRLCPDGTYSFICKVDPDICSVAPCVDYNVDMGAGVGAWRISKSGACTAGAAAYNANQFVADTAVNPRLRTISGVVYCEADFRSKASGVITHSNYYGFGQRSGVTQPQPEQIIPATEEDIKQGLQEKMDADAEASRRLVEAMRKDQAAADAQGKSRPLGLSPVDGDTPVSVTAPPVTGPQTTTKTESKPQPDGSIDTTTEKQQSTVTPQASGNKLGELEIKYPSQTVITSTTTNNVTNNTTTNTSVVNNPTPQEKAGDFPDDYAREETLQQVRDSLKTDGAPDMPDQKPIVDTAVQKDKDDIGTLQDQAKSAQDADKGLWFSWVFDMPTATCSPFSGTVGGYAVSWDLCPMIENIRALLGWLMTIFSGISVYGNLFRRAE